MGFKVIERDQRLVRGERQSLCRRQSHHNAANKPWTGRRRHGIEISQTYARLGQCLFDNRVERLDMRPRGNFGNDATVRTMRLDLAQHDIGQNRAGARRDPADDRSRRFVAAGLYAKDGECAQSIHHANFALPLDRTAPCRKANLP